MPSLPLSKTHGRSTSGVACNFIPWTTHIVEKHQAFYAIIVFGFHTLSDDIRHGMPTWPFRSIHGQTMSDVSCHLRIWATHMVGRRQACIPSSPFIVHMVVRHRVWHEIITLQHDTRSDYGGRGMPSSPLSNSQGRDMSGEACHHIPWTTYTVEKRRAFHAIVVF